MHTALCLCPLVDKCQGSGRDSSVQGEVMLCACKETPQTVVRRLWVISHKAGDKHGEGIPLPMSEGAPAFPTLCYAHLFPSFQKRLHNRPPRSQWRIKQNIKLMCFLPLGDCDYFWSILK